MPEIKKAKSEGKQVPSPLVSGSFDSFFKKEISDSRKVIDVIIKQKDTSFGKSLKTSLSAYLHKDI